MNPENFNLTAFLDKKFPILELKRPTFICTICERITDDWQHPSWPIRRGFCCGHCYNCIVIKSPWNADDAYNFKP